jgi:hypothetical protein
MDVQYEEKTYESYFNVELDGRSTIFFPPGQVQEGVLGIDAAGHSNNRRLWRRLGHPFWFVNEFSGIALENAARHMESLLGESVRNIPNMKVNLLFQYKRPQHITSTRANEWHIWNQPYFRYHIYEKQQELLDHLGRIVGSKALILYAAPAVVDVNELVKLKMQRRIIESTNFTKASLLAGHEVNTYVQAGTHSVAHSVPEEVEAFDLLTFLKTQERSINVPNYKFVTDFSKAVQSAFQEDAYYRGIYASLVEEYRGIENYPLLSSFINLKIARDLTGIQWLIGTD